MPDTCWPGYIAIEARDGCVYVLTHAEWHRAVTRGKQWKRQQALRKRQEAQDVVDNPDHEE